MAAFKGLEDKLEPFGFTLPLGVEAQRAEETSTIELAELMDAETNEWLLVTPHHTVNSKLAISGNGPADFSMVASGSQTPGTYAVVTFEDRQLPNGRCDFTLSAEKSAAFTDADATQPSAGSTAAPTIGGLVITSVAYSVAEEVTRRQMVNNSVLTGSNGQPSARAHTGEKQEFSMMLRGDLPAGVALGRHGAYVYGLTGMLYVKEYAQPQVVDEWNGHRLSGNGYPNIDAVTE